MTGEIWADSPMRAAMEEQMRRIGRKRASEILAEFDVHTAKDLPEDRQKEFLVRLCLEMR